MRTEKIDVRVNHREKTEIEHLAAQQDISVSELVRDALKSYRKKICSREKGNYHLNYHDRLACDDCGEEIR